MKTRLRWALLCWLSLRCFGAHAQITLAQETFEGTSADFGYTNSTIDPATYEVSASVEYFQRVAFNSTGTYPGTTRVLSNRQGSYTWAGEGVRGTGVTNVRPPGYVALNQITTSQNFKDLAVTVALAAPRGGLTSGAGSYSAYNTDRIRIQYAFGSGPWTTVALFMGNNALGTGQGGNFQQILPLSDSTNVARGSAPSGGGTVLTAAYQDITTSLPATALGSNLRVRVVLDIRAVEVAFDNIRVTGVADNTAKPTLSTVESTAASYTEGGSPVQLTNTLTVGYSDNNSATTLTGGTVSIGNFVSGQDMLNFTNQLGITGSYNTGTGVLTLSGMTTQANYQAALRNITYSNSNTSTATGGTRTLTFQVTNGSTLSTTASRNLTVTAVLNTPAALNYTENFDSDGEGTRYFGNSFVSTSQQTGFFRATNSPATSAGNPIGSATFTGWSGGYWYGEGTAEGINNPTAPTSTLQLAPVDTRNRSTIKFTLALGASSGWQQYQDAANPGESFELYYRINGGTPVKFGAFYGANGTARQDADLDKTTLATGTALSTALQDITFTLPVAVAGVSNLDFLLVQQTRGGAELAFDNIRVTGLPLTTVSSLVRASANPTNAATVNYTVTFGAPVTGLTAANFTLTSSGLTGASVGTPVSTGTGSTWTVPVNTGTGNGTLTLNLANDTNLSVDVTTALPFAGETYTIDKTAPAVSSVSVPANGTYGTGRTLSFTINFSEAVTVMGTPQVGLTVGSASRQASYASGSGSTALIFNYTVLSGDLDTDGIALASALTLNGGTLRDAAGNGATLTLTGVPSTAAVLVDAVAPTVAITSSAGNSGSTTGTSPIPFTVTFSKSVTGFVQGDLTVTGGNVAGFAGSGSTYTFTVTPSGSGVAVTVNVAANTAQDAAGNGNTVAASFSITYTVLTVSSVQGQTPSPTATPTVSYTVTFSAAVSGLSTSNFNLTSTGSVSGASVVSVTAISGTMYTVTVNTGTGDGTLRLNVNSSTGVTPAVTGLPYTSGTVYTISKSFAAAPTLRIQAAGSATGNSDVTAFVDGVQILSGGIALANALQNPSFESNNVASSSFLYSPNVVATPWSFGTQAGVSRNSSGFGSTAPVGDAVVFLQSTAGNNGSVSQSLAVPTGSYQVSFQSVQRNYTSRDQVVNVFVNDVFVGSIQPTSATAYQTFTSATFNVTAPTLTATVSTTSASPTSTAPIPFAVSFSQSVGTTFTAADVTVTNGVVTSGSFSGSGAGPYPFTVTPSGVGTVLVSLAAGVANDANNSGNSASNSVSVQFQAPTITVVPIASTLPGGTLGTPYSLTFSASGGSGTYTYALSGPPPPGLTLTSSGTLAGTPTASGTFTFTVTATDNSVAPGPFNGTRSYSLTIGYPDLVISTSGQIVPAGSYNSITVQRGGVGTLAGNILVNGDVTVQSGGVLKDGCALISGSGSFTLAAGGTLSICSAQGISSTGATGTVQVTGTRSFSADALYTYNGTVTQATGTGLPATVRALTLTNPAGLNLTNALTATTAATFTSGVLTTGVNTLTLGSGATLGEDADSYVTGTVQATRNLNMTGSPEAFGGLGLMLTPSGNTLPGSTLVRRVTGTALNGTGSSTSIKRYFDIQPTVNTGLNVALVLLARDDERNGIAPANLRLFKSADSGTSWQLQAATYGTAMANGLTTYSASLSGISDFSLWTLGDANAPLPVTLVSFQALLQDENRALLRWVTASELHSAYFAVERSLDGRTFVEVGRVAAAGTSLLAHTYELRDPLGLTGLTYYRLRQVDTDNSAKYSPVATLAPGTQPVAGVSIYPNPRIGTVSTSVSVQGLANQRLTVQVTDMLGRTVSTQAFTPTTSQATLPLILPIDLAAGVYSISVHAGGQLWTTRLSIMP